MIVDAHACCQSPDAPHRVAPSLAEMGTRILGPNLGPVELVGEPHIDDACHEASHAIAVIALGVTVIAVVAVGQPICRHEAIGRPIDEAVVALAGIVGQRWRLRRSYGSPDTLIAAYAERSGCGGACDACVAVRALRQAAPGLSGSELPALFRSTEAVTLDLIRRPAIWRSIEEVTALAMKKHAIFGYEIEEIAAKHFRPGFFRLELNGLNVTLHEENT